MLIITLVLVFSLLFFPLGCHSSLCLSLEHHPGDHNDNKTQPTSMKDKLGIDEFQKIKDKKDIEWILKTFLLESPELTSQLLTKLRLLRDRLSRSSFFNEHEIIGSSLLVIHYASSKLGVWMIDFAKTVPLPPGVVIDHRSAWKLGNHEDGYLFGLDNLINLVDKIK